MRSVRVTFIQFSVDLFFLWVEISLDKLAKYVIMSFQAMSIEPQVSRHAVHFLPIKSHALIYVTQ